MRELSSAEMRRIAFTLNSDMFGAMVAVGAVRKVGVYFKFSGKAAGPRLLIERSIVRL